MTSSGPASVTRLVAAFSSSCIRTILIPIMRGSGHRESSLRRVPWEESYGKVAVFKALYGNRIDLIEPRLQATRHFVDAEAVVSVEQHGCKAESDPNQRLVRHRTNP